MNVIDQLEKLLRTEVLIQVDEEMRIKLRRKYFGTIEIYAKLAKKNILNITGIVFKKMNTYKLFALTLEYDINRKRGILIWQIQQKMGTFSCSF